MQQNTQQYSIEFWITSKLRKGTGKIGIATNETFEQFAPHIKERVLDAIRANWEGDNDDITEETIHIVSVLNVSVAEALRLDLVNVHNMGVFAKMIKNMRENNQEGPSDDC